MSIGRLLLAPSRWPIGLLGATMVAAASCSGGPSKSGDVAASCSVTAPTSCPAPSPTYADVAGIIQQRCVGPCHSGVPDGPWPLTDYQHVADWADVVRDELVSCSMPPVEAGVGMTAAERLSVLTWIRCGFPQ